MPAVNTRHRIYQTLMNRWAMIRDAVDGEAKVKEAGDEYLPRLTGTDDKEYRAYKMRALFFEATRRTLSGLVGMVMQKLPKIEASESTEEVFLKSLTKDGMSLNGFAAVVLSEVLMLNKYGILADLPPRISTETEPWLIGYTAESIINWEFAPNVDGRIIPTTIVLEEEYEIVDPEDRFVLDTKKQYRVLELINRDSLEAFIEKEKVFVELPTRLPDQVDIYRVQVWRLKKDLAEGGAGAAKDEFIMHDEFFPSWQGNAMDRIPFVVVTAENEDKEDQKPPLEGLASVNMSHYRTSADLEHGRHFTALPTPYIAGLTEQVELHIGSSKAWIITGVDANQIKVGMLEFTGAGLSALKEGMEEKQNQMAILGARLLEQQKKATESFETHKLRSAGEQSILASIANGVSEGINDALKWMTEWDNSLGEMSIRLNTDFIRMSMDPTMLTALIGALQQGKMSFKTYFHNMQERGMYPDEHSEEDEIALITDDAANMPGLNLGDDEEEEEEEEEEEGEEE